MQSLFIRFTIVTIVAIAATDAIVFHHVRINGVESLTTPFVASVIFITVLPIAINLWFWLIFKQRKK